MRGISREEVQDLTSYEKGRAAARIAVIRLRELRRIQAGEKLSLVFENRQTVLYHIHEMVRAERMIEEAAIAHEIETYNALIPGPGELSATLFIELSEPGRIRDDLESFLGLDRGPHVSFDLGQEGRVFARFEEGHSEETRISAVHYVRFAFTPEQVRHFASAEGSIDFVVEHPNYQWRGALSPQARASLASDFEE
ncbi:MAG: DUF3501 family protein [Candidatus Eisenbacteria bacterium]